MWRGPTRAKVDKLPVSQVSQSDFPFVYFELVRTRDKYLPKADQ